MIASNVQPSKEEQEIELAKRAELSRLWQRQKEAEAMIATLNGASASAASSSADKRTLVLSTESAKSEEKAANVQDAAHFKVPEVPAKRLAATDLPKKPAAAAAAPAQQEEPKTARKLLKCSSRSAFIEDEAEEDNQEEQQPNSEDDEDGEDEDEYDSAFVVPDDAPLDSWDQSPSPVQHPQERKEPEEKKKQKPRPPKKQVSPAASSSSSSSASSSKVAGGASKHVTNLPACDEIAELEKKIREAKEKLRKEHKSAVDKARRERLKKEREAAATEAEKKKQKKRHKKHKSDVSDTSSSSSSDDKKKRKAKPKSKDCRIALESATAEIRILRRDIMTAHNASAAWHQQLESIIAKLDMNRAADEQSDEEPPSKKRRH